MQCPEGDGEVINQMARHTCHGLVGKRLTGAATEKLNGVGRIIGAARFAGTIFAGFFPEGKEGCIITFVGE